MAKDLHVDAAAMNTAAAAFRTLPAPLDTVRKPLYPLTLNLGQFGEGTSLVTTITGGVGNFETALLMYSTTFTDLDTTLVRAATVLTDADEGNDGDPLDDIHAIGPQA